MEREKRLHRKRYVQLERNWIYWDATGAEHGYRDNLRVLLGVMIHRQVTVIRKAGRCLNGCMEIKLLVARACIPRTTFGKDFC